MRIPIFAHEHDPVPSHVEMSWEEWAEHLQADPPVVADKHRRPAWAPYVAQHGRTARDVEAFQFLVYDFDRLTADQATLVIERASRFEGLIHTSYSHHREKHIALRVILPLEGPLHPAKYFGAWELGRAYLGECADRQAKKLTQIYFLPCHHPDDPPPSFLRTTGPRFDPWLLPGGLPVDRQALAFVARSLARLTDTPSRALVAHAAQRACQGEALAPEGSRDDAMFLLAAAYERLLSPKGYDPETLLPLLAPSLLHPDMGPDAPEKFREKLLRLWRTGREKILSATSARVRQHMAWIGQPERDHPYDSHEKAFMAQFNPSPCNALVAFDRQVYVLTLTGYQDIGSLDTAILDAACAAHEITLGPGDTAASILKRVGMRVRELRYSYHGGGFCDAQRLTIRTAARREGLVPERSTLVEEFLHALVGGRAATLLRWLAWLPHTTDPLAAIYLHGAPGAGKSLFARGCAHLWQGPLATLDNALGPFPTSLLASPLVFGDEAFPRQADGRHKTEEFRRLIASREHEINRKFRDLTTLEGCVRIILAANNEDILRTQSLTDDDVRAIADRILDFDVSPDGERFLRAVDPADLLVRIPRHALYLYEHERPQPHGRFLVQNTDQGFAQKLAITTNVSSRVLEICFEFLARPGAHPGLVVRGKELFVLPARLKELYEMKGGTISAIALGNALRTLAHGEKVYLRERKNGLHGYYLKMRTEMLGHWAQLTGNDPEIIYEGLRHDTHRGPNDAQQFS